MMVSKVTLLLLWSIFIVDMECQDLEDSDCVCEVESVACICVENGEGKLVYVEDNITAERDPLTEQFICVYSDPDEICANISCYYAEGDLFPYLKLQDDHGNFLDIPPIEILARNGPSRLFDSNVCPVNCIEKASIDCFDLDLGRICHITCMYGHAHVAADGSSEIVKRVWCLYDENVWRPHEFGACWPYMNCTLELVNDGYTLGKYAGPVYDITCLHPTDNSTSQHHCIDGNCTPPLPKCVETKNEKHIEPPEEGHGNWQNHGNEQNYGNEWNHGNEWL